MKLSKEEFDDRLKEFYAQMGENIKTYGVHLQGVGGGPKGILPFIYTIGHAELNLPELLAIGGNNGEWGVLMNDLSKKMRDRGRRFRDGEIVETILTRPVKMIDCTPVVKDLHTVQVGEYYPDKTYTVMQVLISDEDGVYPDDPNCKPPQSTIPVFAWSK